MSRIGGRRLTSYAGARVPAHVALSVAALLAASLAFTNVHAETMSDALARAYRTNPDFNQQRAGVRATDETIPQATAAYRPTVTATGQYGYSNLAVHEPGTGVSSLGGVGAGGAITSGNFKASTDTGNIGATMTETIFNGNRNYNGVRQAESNVLGARETLRNTEESVLQNGATAYMDVLRDTAILDLRKNNIIVLEEQLRQTRDRFNVGEVTRTDVAQAASSLASARSDYFTAQANLETSIANYHEVIGVDPDRLATGALGRRAVTAYLGFRDPRRHARTSGSAGGFASGRCRRVAGQDPGRRVDADGDAQRLRRAEL